MTANYAAKLCSDLVYNGYNDWFLPSRYELNLMYTNLNPYYFYGFTGKTYWSSSEADDNHPYNEWAIYFYNGVQSKTSRNNSNRIRPIRAF